MMQTNPAQYRLRLLSDVLRGIVLPSVVLSSISRLLHVRFGLLAIPAHVFFIAIWIIARSLYTQRRHFLEAHQLGARPIPCVKGKWPGNIDVLLRMLKAFKKSYVLDVYRDLFEEYKCTTLNTRILWVDQIITMDQRHEQFVLATGFENFSRGWSQKERMETFLGSGIFNRDDQIWKMHRGNARPFFARERISDFDIFERHAQRTLSVISSRASTRTAVEAQDLYGRFTLDSASEFLFGQNLNTLSAVLPDPERAAIGPKGSATYDDWGSFAQAFEGIQQVITARSRLGYFWPIAELFSDKTAEHAKVIRNWIDPLVTDALKSKSRALSSSPIEEKSFLQHLANSTDDVNLIRDQLLNMLLASRDTTACLISYVTYFMALDPSLVQRLRDEILAHVGPDAAPTYESIRQLKYMRAVIQETLRLFPPVPLNVRESRPTPCALPPQDATYPETAEEPLYMPARTGVMYFPLLMQRNTALWGPDAEVFDPERWLDRERLAKFTSDPTKYAPFSAGPRICVGQNYALNEASYFLVRLLQQFDTFALASDVQPADSLPPLEWKARAGRQSVEKIWPSAALTLYIKGGLWVRYSKSNTPARSAIRYGTV